MLKIYFFFAQISFLLVLHCIHGFRFTYYFNILPVQSNWLLNNDTILNTTYVKLWLSYARRKSILVDKGDMFIIQQEGISDCTLSSGNQVTMSSVLIVIQTTIVNNLKLQI